MESYNEALNIALNSRLISHAEEPQNFITAIYSNQGNLEKYKIENQKNLDQSIKSDNKILELKSRLALGSIYKLQGDHFKAVENYNKSYILFHNKVDYDAQLIEQREYGISDKEKMGTHLVTACIVVIAQDPENKKSVLGHIDLRTNVETAISQDILGKFPEDKKLNVYLLGGSDSSDAKYTSKDNLKKVINELKKYPNI